MSASDSDNSIDWLASDDDEDVESEPELDRSPAHPAQTPPPPSPGSPRSYGGERKDGGGWGAGSGEDSGQGSPPACCAAETWDGGRAPGAGAGLCLAGAGGRPERSKGRKAHKRPLSPVGTEHRERQPGVNQGDKNRLFTAKCMELRCYIHPLSSILTGLRTGRYRERLSSFQESVAMDRIQRIMGVLQNPCMGERYINIILKMEEMLKTWFPNIKPRDQHTVAQTEEPAPTKKAKLSASGVAPPGSAVCPFTVSSTPSAAAAKPPRVTDPAPPPGAYPAGANAKRLHGSAHAGPLSAEQQAHAARPPPPSIPRCRATAALTQDSAVSSSTDGRCAAGTDSAPGRPDSAPGRPGPAKISAPCLERLLKSTESIIGHKGAPPPGGGVTGSGCS